MIAPLRTDADETSPLFSEPRLIGELLGVVLARRGIDLSAEREPHEQRLPAAGKRPLTSDPAHADQVA